MKIIKTLINNLILTTIFFYSIVLMLNLIDLSQGKIMDTDFEGVVIFTAIGAFFFSIIFIFIQSLFSLLKKNLFSIRNNKLMLFIPLGSVLIVEMFDFRWFGWIKNIDIAFYFNYVLLCIIFLVLYILLLYAYKKIAAFYRVKK